MTSLTETKAYHKQSLMVMMLTSIFILYTGNATPNGVNFTGNLHIYPNGIFTQSF